MIDEKNNPSVTAADAPQDGAQSGSGNAPAFDIEGSTVFSAPEKKGVKDTSKKDRRGLRRIVVLAAVMVIAGALTGGWILLRSLIPDDSGETSSIDSGEIKLFEASKDDAESLTINNAGKTVKVYSTVTPAEDTSSDSSDVVTWFVDGIDANLTDSDNISYTVGDACSLTASREMTGDADYGLDSPWLTLNLKMRDSAGKTGYTLSVGGVSPDKKGYYCSIDTAAGKVYLIEASVIELLAVDVTDFGTKTLCETITEDDTGEGYFDYDSFERLDSVTVKGGDGTIKVVMNPDGNYNKYLVTSPKRRYADETAVKGLLTPLTEGLTADRVLCFGADTASLEKYGLTKPACTAEYAVGKYILKLRVGAVDSDGYAAIAVGDSPKAIYKIDVSDLPFYGISADSLYTKYLFFENIADVKQIKLSGADGTYNFVLTHLDTGEEDDDAEDLSVTCNGKVINTDDFRMFYQHLLVISANSFTDEKASGGKIAEVDISYVDTAVKTTSIVYSGYSDMRYHAALNGEPYGIVTGANIDMIIKDAQNLVDGKSVD